jgi:DNA mismatch repair ATPase MutS
MEISIYSQRVSKNIEFMNGVKEKYNCKCMVLFRCGDYYETYGEYAEDCAQQLGLVLRNDEGILSVAFPHFQLDVYLPILVRKGYRVAIADGE